MYHVPCQPTAVCVYAFFALRLREKKRKNKKLKDATQGMKCQFVSRGIGIYIHSYIDKMLQCRGEYSFDRRALSCLIAAGGIPNGLLLYYFMSEAVIRTVDRAFYVFHVIFLILS